MVWIETPTNPLLKVLDIRAIADATHAVDGLLVVDNTFASPYLQQPLELGADIVVHSTTKYIGGHSDVVGGFAGTSDHAMGERLRFLQNALGAVPAPLDCFLTLRGLKTLAVRMERHCDNAERIAARLAASSAVSQVLLPGPRGRSRPRGGAAADAPLRRHGQLPRARRARRRRPGARRTPACGRSARASAASRA